MPVLVGWLVGWTKWATKPKTQKSKISASFQLKTKVFLHKNFCKKKVLTLKKSDFQNRFSFFFLVLVDCFFKAIYRKSKCLREISHFWKKPKNKSKTKTANIKNVTKEIMKITYILIRNSLENISWKNKFIKLSCCWCNNNNITTVFVTHTHTHTHTHTQNSVHLSNKQKKTNVIWQLSNRIYQFFRFLVDKLLYMWICCCMWSISKNDFLICFLLSTSFFFFWEKWINPSGKEKETENVFGKNLQSEINIYIDRFQNVFQMNVCFTAMHFRFLFLVLVFGWNSQ